MDTITQAVIGTPIWVWILLVLFIHLGIKAFNPHKKKIIGLIVVPAVFVYISFSNWQTLNSTVLWSMLAGYGIGILLGLLLTIVNINNIKWNVKDPKAIILPGTKFILIRFLLLFVLNYIKNYEHAVSSIGTHLFWNTYGIPIVSGIQSFVTGVIIGNSIILVGIILKNNWHAKQTMPPTT